jgi:hypothetical protein
MNLSEMQNFWNFEDFLYTNAAQKLKRTRKKLLKAMGVLKQELR